MSHKYCYCCCYYKHREWVATSVFKVYWFYMHVCFYVLFVLYCFYIVRNNAWKILFEILSSCMTKTTRTPAVTNLSRVPGCSWFWEEDFDNNCEMLVLVNWWNVVWDKQRRRRCCGTKELTYSTYIACRIYSASGCDRCGSRPLSMPQSPVVPQT